MKNVRGARLFGRRTKSQNYLKGKKWRLNLMQLFVWKIHNFIREVVKKNGYFTVRLTVGGGGSAPSALTENFDPFFLI